MSISKLYEGMGFRYLHDFSVALLGKQGWRLVTNPNNLVARNFKAKYYLKSTFLGAKLGASPSFVWRSILEAQQLLRQGLGCRVGNGVNVSIIEDPWLPVAENPYVTTVNETIEEKQYQL